MATPPDSTRASFDSPDFGTSPESSEAVLYRRSGHLAEIVLNRPDNRNSMTAELLESFADASEQARLESSKPGGPRCLIIRGEGSCFSAGADFRAGLQVGEGLPHEKSFAMYKPFLSVLDIPVPVIGCLSGHAVGGGFGLALVCDLRIASADAKYGANFVKLGFHPGMAISYLLPRLIGLAKANELLLTGRLFRGDEGERIGLFNAAVPSEEVWERSLSLATTIAEAAPMAVRTTKAALRDGLAWEPRRAARQEAALQAESVQTEDAKEGMAALLEKRKPEFKSR